MGIFSNSKQFLKIVHVQKSLRWQVAQAAEWRWWQRYLRIKPKTAYLEWKRTYWQQLIARIQPPLALLPNARVLDAGCGPAGIFLALPQCSVTALDPLLDKYTTTLPHFSPTDYPYTHFICRALEDWQETNAFDVVFCMNAINHVSDIEQCLANLAASARPNAPIILTIDAHNYAFFKHLFRTLPGDILHPCQYDLTEYKAMLIRQGIEITHTIPIKCEFFFTHYLLCGKKLDL